MAAACNSETSSHVYKITPGHVPEDSTVRGYSIELRADSSI
jgi:hypothetical protein